MELKVDPKTHQLVLSGTLPSAMVDRIMAHATQAAQVAAMLRELELLSGDRREIVAALEMRDRRIAELEREVCRLRVERP